MVDDRTMIVSDPDRLKWWVKINEPKFNRESSGGQCTSEEVSKGERASEDSFK